MGKCIISLEALFLPERGSFILKKKTAVEITVLFLA
jgi:hypothetical protein